MTTLQFMGVMAYVASQALRYAVGVAGVVLLFVLMMIFALAFCVGPD